VLAVFYGVESGNQRVLDLMKKGITVDEIRRAFDLTRGGAEDDRLVHGRQRRGHGGHDRRDGRPLPEIAPDHFGFAVATPLPGTEFHRIAKERGWIESTDWRDYSEFVPVARNEALTRDRIRALRDRVDREVREHLSRRPQEAAMPSVPPVTAPAPARTPCAPCAPPPSGLRGVVRSLPVLGPVLRYAWWWMTLPVRVNRILDHLRTQPGGAAGRPFRRHAFLPGGSRPSSRLGRTPAGRGPPANG